MAQLASGTMLAGYRIERFLAQGGMGVVYLASQMSLDRPIALKLIAPERAGDEDFRERFLRESRLAASIDHPNVVPVHEAGEEDGLLYVAMRYVDGPDLGALLRAAGKLPPQRAARIVAQVAAALDAAHARGLVHRDVKPANVLVADPGGAEHCYLTDFGLSKQVAATTDVTRTGTVMGTVHYIAPEQLRGDAVDGRADVYALGCVLYRLLTGRPPFARDTDVATMWAHLNEPPPEVEGAAAPFEDVVHRAMEKDPAQRFQSAGDLGRAALLAAAVRDEASTAAVSSGARAGVAAPIAPAPRRRRRPVWAAAAGFAAVAAAGVAAIALNGDASEKPAAARAETLRVTKRIPLGGFPLTATTAGGRLWITLVDEARLDVLDTRTGKVSQSPRYGKQLSMVAAGGGRLWVGDYGAHDEDGRGTVVEVDPASGRERRRIATIEPYQLEADADSVWISDADDSVQRVDVRRGKAGRPIRQDRPLDIALAGGRVWVVANGDGQLVPFDARTGRSAGRPVEVGARPLIEAAAQDALWVVTEPGKLVRVRPGSDRTTAVAVGGPDPQRYISADAGSVWVIDDRGDVTVADARHPERQQRLRVGRELLYIVPDGAGAWALQGSSAAVSSAVRVERG
jgi:serine/threonine-protein kinase